MATEFEQILQENPRVLAFVESRIGGRSENQDCYGAASDTPFGSVVTVCDGMGGGPGGKTASRIAVDEILQGIKEAGTDEIIPNVIVKAIRRANVAIIEAGVENPSLKGMGSTATVLVINEYAAYVAHVGDSRIYQFREGSKVFRTFDHSHVFELVKMGRITEEQARLSAESNVITRSLGHNPDVDVDWQILPYQRGDRFMLTTDGVHGSVPEKQLIKLAVHRKPLNVVTDTIAMTMDNVGVDSGGGHDNLTVLMVEMKKNSQLYKKMSKKFKIAMAVLCVIAIVSITGNVISYLRTNDVKYPVEELKDLSVTSHKLDSLIMNSKDSLDQKACDSLNKKVINLVDTISAKINK